MNKNQRIAQYLAGLASCLEGAAAATQSIRGILLENDIVPATVNPPVLTAAGVPPKCAPANDEWKNEMTEAMHRRGQVTDNIVKVPVTTNFNKGQYAAALSHAKSNRDLCTPQDRRPQGDATDWKSNWSAEPVCPVTSDTPYSTVFRETDYLKRIDQNASNIFYKITLGPDRGAVLVVNKKTNKVVRDGRFTVPQHCRGLALVSKDQDGKDYVKKIRETRLEANKSTKLVRYYRPSRQRSWRRKGIEKPYTHCVIYPA